MSIPQEVAELSENEGIAVLRQAGDLLLMDENLRKFGYYMSKSMSL